MKPVSDVRSVDHVSNALDAALEMTFPASDPVAVYVAADDIAPRLNEHFTIQEVNMIGFVTNIESDTVENNDYRRVLYTGQHTQLVLMTLQPGEDIGQETHEEHDQFIRVESGAGKVILDGEEHRLSDGIAVVIPAGVRHNVINTSRDAPLRLYTLYSPPEHPDGTVHRTKRDELAEH